jgi:integrase
VTRLRTSEGSAYESRGKLFARVTVAPQKRVTVLLSWTTDRAVADTRAKDLQRLVNRLRSAGKEDWIKNVLDSGATPDAEKFAELVRIVDEIAGEVWEHVESQARAPDAPLTFRKFAEEWTSGDLHRRYPDHIEPKASVVDDVERLTKHVYPHVQDVPLVAFTREHADGVMAKLPLHLRRGTRRQVAQLINRILNLAAFTGAIKASPLPRGWLPKAPRADSVAKESLLPSEEAKLLHGRNAVGVVVVPLAYRVAYAFLHREGMRKGEAARLTWADIELAKGLVSLDENKTDRPRSWVLNAGVARILERWKKVCGSPKSSASVFPGVAWDKLAPSYRDHCKAVGIERARLYQAKANKLQLRAHDMRAFFVTAGMFAGKDALWITDRSGHTSLGMLRTYERDVRRWRELGEAPVDADAAIPEFAARATEANRGSARIEGGDPSSTVVLNAAESRDAPTDDAAPPAFRFRRRKAWGFESLPVHF